MPWINHLPPVCWSTFGILVWNDSGYVNLTQWWYFFIIFEYILHISTPHIMIFCFPLPYFPLSQQVLYFLLSTLVLTLYIDVVLSLSIFNFPGKTLKLFPPNFKFVLTFPYWEYVQILRQIWWDKPINFGIPLTIFIRGQFWALGIVPVSLACVCVRVCAPIPCCMSAW